MITEVQAKRFQLLHEKEAVETIPLKELFRRTESISKGIKLIHIPSMDYQLSENGNESVNIAFDILFEETLRQNGYLTSSDN